VGVLIAGMLVSTRFRLNAATHDVLMAEIDRFKRGERAPASPQAQAIVEDLSGWRYAELWGNNPVAGVRTQPSA
jgi:oligogalacturonide transporter